MTKVPSSENQYKRAMESRHPDGRRASSCLLLLLIVAIASAALRSVAAGVSVCSDLCTCSNQNFATVECVFDGETRWPPDAAGGPTLRQRDRFVLDSLLELPASATALNIKLTARGTLIFAKGFFKQNNVNRLSIDGSDSPPGTETVVEFREGALCDNHGGFPEVLVTNVNRLAVNKNISCGAHLLNVTHVKAVSLKTDFLSVNEAEIFIKNVQNLKIDPNAFRGSTLSKVQILNTTIESLPKLGASFRLLSFNWCNISEIESYAFDANEIGHIEFVHCRLGYLRQQAVTERLLSNSLIFRGCNIHHIERQFVDGCGLEVLQLAGNVIDEIAPGALAYTSIHTTITDNHITRTGNRWLHPKQWTNVTVAGNSFGIFDGFTLGSADETKAHCYFGNNSLREPQAGSFAFARNCHVDGVHFYRECDCSYESWMAELFGGTMPTAGTGLATCKVEESLRYCFNRSVPATNDTTATDTDERVNVHFFLTEFCQKSGSSIRCSSYASGSGSEDLKPPPFIPSEKINSLDEAGNAWLSSLSREWIYGTTVIAVSVIIVGFVCVYRYWQRKHVEPHIIMIDRTTGQDTMRSSGAPRASTLTDGDRKVMENALRWLGNTYDAKEFNEVNMPMQKLLKKSSGAISEQEKVQLIGSILDSFKRHNINGEQIVALNAIFYRYLGPPPVTEQTSDGSRTDGDGRQEDPHGHIYAEVQQNRRPLGTHAGLLDDYAAPLDHGGATTTTVPEGIYAEPILRHGHDQQLLQHTGNRHLISPYAIGDATVPRNSSGTETGNLPDVILPRPRVRSPDRDPDRSEEEDEDYDDEIDGEPERKIMLRPPDADGGGYAGVSNASGPTYAISMKKLTARNAQRKDNTPLPPLPAPRAAAAAAAANASASTDDSDGTDGNRSEHSGSSMQTVRIEDITLADDDERTRGQQYECSK